jgi:phage terminase small subunit
MPVPASATLDPDRGAEAAGQPLGGPEPERPKPRRLPPEEPGWLGEEAAEVWDQMVPQFMATRVLAQIDGNAMARYCEH